MEASLDYDRCDPTSIERYAKKLIDRTLRSMLGPEAIDIIIDVRNIRSRGTFGEVLEKHYFKIRPDNRSGRPDFEEAGVELKSSPIRRRGVRFVAKERMVLSMIDYMQLVDEKWDTSSFLRKNRHLLTIFYLHEEGMTVIEYRIKIVGLWDFPEDDLKIIRDDWVRIQAKVKEGRAEEISEGDTNYLGACTKGQDARTNWRCQPRSDVKAKGRAFSLKASYVNSMIETMMGRGDAEPLENKVVKDLEDIRERTFEDLVIERFGPYIGKEVNQIALEVGVVAKRSAKNFNDLITKAILKVKDRMVEFDKADIVVKSIVLETSGRLKESVSFPAFDYIELDKERDWESSKIRGLFDRRFFFVVYQKRPDGARILRNVIFWNIPPKDLQEVRQVWMSARRSIHEGRYEDLPRISDNPVSHVRPHGRNAKDKVPAPDGTMQIRRCFWLNARYVAGQIGASKWEDYMQTKLPGYENGSVVIR